MYQFQLEHSVYDKVITYNKKYNWYHSLRLFQFKSVDDAVIYVWLYIDH